MVESSTDYCAVYVWELVSYWIIKSTDTSDHWHCQSCSSYTYVLYSFPGGTLLFTEAQRRPNKSYQGDFVAQSSVIWIRWRRLKSGTCLEESLSLRPYLPLPHSLSLLLQHVGCSTSIQCGRSVIADTCILRLPSILRGVYQRGNSYRLSIICPLQILDQAHGHRSWSAYLGFAIPMLWAQRARRRLNPFFRNA